MDALTRKTAQEASRLKSEIKVLKEKNTELVGALKHNEEQLTEIGTFSSPLQTEGMELTLQKWKQLGDRIRAFVETYFEQSLSETLLQDDTAWKSLSEPVNEEHKVLLCKHNVPLPRSNSIQAKQMRTAVIFCIIARSMHVHIFQPTYLFGADQEVRKVLVRQAIADSRKEAFFRRLLLSICPEEQQEVLEERLENVVNDLQPVIAGFSTCGHQSTADQAFIELLRYTAQTWHTIRSLEPHFAPSFDNFRSPDWQPLSLSPRPSQANQVTPENSGDGMLAIFPALYIIENSKKPRCLVRGAVLCRSQTGEAEQELDREAQTTAFGSLVIRSMSRKQRSKSTSGQVNHMHKRQHFLGVSGNGHPEVGGPGPVAPDIAHTKVL